MATFRGIGPGKIIGLNSFPFCSRDWKYNAPNNTYIHKVTNNQISRAEFTGLLEGLNLNVCYVPPPKVVSTIDKLLLVHKLKLKGK